MQGPRATFIYLAVVFGLLVIPRALQRFRLPAPLTCFAFGVIAAGFFKPLIGDSVIAYLATLGIAALFLFAGLEVDLVELRRQLPSLAGHFAVRGFVLVICARVIALYFHLGWQVDWLIALALLTPSTGFILDMLPHSGLDHTEQSEVALHAITGEVTAIFLFLVICAVITKTLGVYYLVGAFVAGLVARSLSKRMTTLASPENLEAIRLFASFFIPFYFFSQWPRRTKRCFGFCLFAVWVGAGCLRHPGSPGRGLATIALPGA